VTRSFRIHDIKALIIYCFVYPFFTEFSPVFRIDDQLFQTKEHFLGNFTLKVVGGGVGNVKNIERFTKEEIDLYNFRNGKK